MNLIYDVCHNIAKLEEHTVAGRKKKVWVHRKGATRAFPPGHPEVPAIYRGIGQPVIIPGDMGRASWVLVGQQGSMDRTFGTTCHGAGRVMSRTAAREKFRWSHFKKMLEDAGVQLLSAGIDEAPGVYKDIHQVMNAQDDLVKIIARFDPKIVRMADAGEKPED